MPTPLERAEHMTNLYEKVADKILAAPPNTQLIMERTFSTACMVLEELNDISVAELAIGISQFCNGLPSQFSKPYISQVSLAFRNPVAFVKGLHDFYSTLTDEVRRKKKFPQIADLLGAVLRKQVERRNPVNQNVINSYLDLTMQTMEYLRPNPDALDTCILGVSTKGVPLEGPCPYPFSDGPSIQLRRMPDFNNGQKNLGDSWAEICRLYARYGISIKSIQDITDLEQVQRGYTNTVAALLPLINETTFTFAPTRIYNSCYAPLIHLDYTPFAVEELQEQLIVSRKPLPKEGVRIQFGDPTGELLELHLMETLYKDKPYILYKFSFGCGDMSGYYDIMDCFLFSILLDGRSSTPFFNLRFIFFAIYSTLALPEGTMPPLSSIFTQKHFPLQIHIPAS